MSKRKNWNMLHTHRCPMCGSDLLPLNAESTLLVCQNSYKKKPCKFTVRPENRVRICNSLIMRVGLST